MKTMLYPEVSEEHSRVFPMAMHAMRSVSAVSGGHAM
jgi:hypothetical protein